MLSDGNPSSRLSGDILSQGIEGISAKKAVDHHRHCADCGALAHRKFWVRIDDYLAISRGLRPLCIGCRQLYDRE